MADTPAPVQAAPEGVAINPETLMQVQSNFIAQARVKEVQMEAVIQDLSMQLAAANRRIAELEAAADDEDFEIEEA